jgi:hypothetical protein
VAPDEKLAQNEHIRKVFGLFLKRCAEQKKTAFKGLELSNIIPI